MSKLTFIGKMIAQRPKPKSAVPTIKKMTKAIEGMGKSVGGYEMRPDGAVRVFIADDPKPTAEPNPWDEVLP